jgi:hypothetical protein
MATISDARFEALRGQGFTGATSDMLLQWLQANGATANAVPDAWAEMLAANGFPYGQRNDSWYDLLGSLGYTGALSDRELEFWDQGGGVISSDGVRITDQPDNWSGLEGETATFTVVATSGNGSPLTYQWEELINGTWSNVVDGGRVSGATTATLTITPTEVTDNGRIFRVYVCNSFNCIYSRNVLLSITGATWFILDELGNRIFAEATVGTGNDETVSEDSQ